MTDRPPLAQVLATWGKLRRRLRLRVYVHHIDPCPAHRLPIWHHRLSIPPKGPWLVLCPRGPWRWEPAAWGLTFEERLVSADMGALRASYIGQDRMLKP